MGCFSVLNWGLKLPAFLSEAVFESVGSSFFSQSRALDSGADRCLYERTLALPTFQLSSKQARAVSNRRDNKQSNRTQ